MQLHQITLEHVRLHRQLNLPLASGITVLEGPMNRAKAPLLRPSTGPCFCQPAVPVLP